MKTLYMTMMEIVKTRKHTLQAGLSLLVICAVMMTLIVPAWTLDRDEAEAQGGIDLPAVEEASEESQEESTKPAEPAQEESTSAAEAKEDSEKEQPAEEKPAAEDTEKDKNVEEAKAEQDEAAEAEEADEKAIEETVLTADGKKFEASVTCGQKSGIPEDAGLEVKELKGDEYRDYLGRTAAAMEAGGFEYARIFDITITDAEGNKIQPDAKVEVSLKLKDAPTSDYEVVHFKGEEEEPEQMKIEGDGKVVTFQAESFSAYAIVQGPSEVPVEWSQVKTLAALKELASGGLYIGTTSGYYLTNETAKGSQDQNTTGIVKTKPAQSYPPVNEAKKYYFEQVSGSENQFYVYCYDNDNNKQYVRNTGDANLTFTDENGKTAFEVLVEKDGRFRLHNGNRYWNMWNGANANHIAAWTTANDSNNYFYIWQRKPSESDPYELDGMAYGLMSWNDSIAGKALMAEEGEGGSLKALALTVMAKAGADSDKLFVPDNSDITLWNFQWAGEDKYYLKATAGTTDKYLQITGDGLALADAPSESCKIQVVPGSGAHAGEICLKYGNKTLTFSGKTSTGFSTGGAAGTEWLKLVEVSDLTPDYFMTHSASKISVSDESVTNGSRVIVYTRVWNDTTKRYEFYAVDHDGSLVRCYESGDDIQWVGSKLNTLQWDFTEYYWQGTTDPNFYYELYNQYDKKYMAPSGDPDSVLSNNTIGINMNGRKNGQYYSTILAWDEAHYDYMGLKADKASGKVVSCPKSEADDFYFAIVQDVNVDDELHTVKTVDHTQYGIKMKIVDFGNRDEMTSFLGSNNQYVNGNTESGLLSTDLKNGYPVSKANNSLSRWFANAKEVNHLFIQSTFDATGYYEYDSTQNFASLKGNDFVVYKEIGTMNKENAGTGKFYTHGQFMPFNDLEAGVFSKDNPRNLTSATGSNLPDSDPRKNEKLYLIENQNYYMGVELEASFTQTPDGLDDWGHDIIYEFTGDDDFWLYVDGELVIDLGGIHDAIPGTVNFRTGDVNVNGTKTTLKALFESNYRGRHEYASDAEVADYLDQYFKPGTSVFKDYSTHTMKIYYLERGAGASNLHMRFNLASIKPGTVQLSKELEGVEDPKSVLAEFPYQIWYKKDGKDHLLSNATHGDTPQTEDYVYYMGTKTVVPFKESLKIAGKEYKNVFMLKPGETAEISFPEGTTEYRIVECGVDTTVYDSVKVNAAKVTGTAVEGAANRKDYGIDYATMASRARVHYTNKVNPKAIKNLTFTKKLYKEDGINEITNDPTNFNFRLYLATEFDGDIDNSPADMHTYHIKDPQGNYCRWDAVQGKLVSLGTTNYDDLSADQQKQATFTTSMTGAIANIPVGYTVEVMGVLAGTTFKVVERPKEIPDGYAFQKYVHEGYSAAEGKTPDEIATAGVTGKVTSQEDHPHVDICNLKGWGLRVNKVWSDKDYMTGRDATYFAVFTDDGEGHLTLVQNTVRKLAYGKESLYWYFLRLPVQGVAFNNYEIREVTISATTPELDSDGETVTNPGTVTPIHQDEEVTLNGKQRGENVSGSFQYKVDYKKGKVQSESNVRVDTVTNDRPGLTIKKTDQDGKKLAGATFTLKTNDGTEIGTFTSDEEGFVTVAYLAEGCEYTLTEVRAPHPYRGLNSSVTLKLENGKVAVSGAESSEYSLTGDGTLPETLTIKNREYLFRAIKKDGDTQVPLQDVKFALHKQHTVGGVTQFDTTPMEGYEQLVTGEDGAIPKLDNTLPAGTYQLRESETQNGYQKLSQYIEFTISETGEISLKQGMTDVTLAGKATEDGKYSYTLTIANHRYAGVTIAKIDDEKTPLAGATFELCKDNGSTWEAVPGHEEIDLTSVTSTTLEDLVEGSYRLTETKAPDGYVILTKSVYFTISYDTNGKAVLKLTEENGTPLADPVATENARVSNTTIQVINTPGPQLPSAGGMGTHWLYALGAVLVLGCVIVLVARRRV